MFHAKSGKIKGPFQCILMLLKPLCQFLVLYSMFVVGSGFIRNKKYSITVNVSVAITCYNHLDDAVILLQFRYNVGVIIIF